MAGVVGITFALYSEQSGGSALWLETQNVTADGGGRYLVLLGATKPDRLPADFFTSEQARWAGVASFGAAGAAASAAGQRPVRIEGGRRGNGWGAAALGVRTGRSSSQWARGSKRLSCQCGGERFAANRQ